MNSSPLLSPADVVVLLIDPQPGLAFVIESQSRSTLENRVGRFADKQIPERSSFGEPIFIRGNPKSGALPAWRRPTRYAKLYSGDSCLIPRGCFYKDSIGLRQRESARGARLTRLGCCGEAVWVGWIVMTGVGSTLGVVPCGDSM